jgi:hypothetical protein
MKTMHPEQRLERLLVALERDVLDATDEEILAAARELGMNPAMKGSAAFFGVMRLARVPSLPGKSLRGKYGSIARRRASKDDAPPST